MYPHSKEYPRVCVDDSLIGVAPGTTDWWILVDQILFGIHPGVYVGKGCKR